jgi:16S rRNA (adenine1518-N6/adenine1519-N6)-dimethyltransferase
LPRKLGQHFLRNPAILERIAEAACEEHAPRVIEIGPGRGALTRYLLARAEELHAIELDRALLPALESEFGGNEHFHLHHGDVLDTDLSQWGPAVIAGNLPYYITSPIIERFLKLGDGFGHAVFLIQEEVADRLRAAPGTRDYGFLSVQTQLFCQVELICRVPPGAFAPPPKVSSAVVRLTKQRSLDTQYERLLTFIGRCFAHKRKTIRNNLKPYFDPAALNRLKEAELRAEQIPVTHFSEMLETLEGASVLD